METSQNQTSVNLEKLTSLQEGFRANLSVLLGKGVEIAMKGIYGRNSVGSLAKFDRDSVSWKMSQDSYQLMLDGSLETFSPTWPRSGIMLCGTAYQLPPLVRLIKGTGCGFWLTPTSTLIDERSPEAIVKRKKYRESIGRKTVPPGTLAEQVKAPQMWPTPTASGFGEEGPETWLIRQKAGKVSTPPLGLAVKMWPTPTANEDACGKSTGKMQKMLGNHPDVRTPNGGQLNPMWVEWLMGYPTEWTALDASETELFRKSRKSSSKKSEN